MDRREAEALRTWRERQYSRRRRSSAWLIDEAVREARTLCERRFIRPPRPARCGWPLGRTGIHVREGKAFISGLEHCASPWCCPACTPIIRAHRARDLRTAITNWQAAGETHLLAFVTLTIPHKRDDQLAAMLDLVSPAWSRLTGSRQWRRLKQQVGIRHYVRALEVTWSPKAGWHAHLHVLLFLDRSTDRRGLQREIGGLWADGVKAIAPERRRPSKRRGVLIETAGDNPTPLADYMAKSPDRKPDLANELTRADIKRGRKESLAPFQLLDDPVINGLGRDTASGLWLEYVHATYRRRSITWSRDLRSDLGLTVEEPTDEQIIQQTIGGIEVIPLDHHECRALTDNPNILSHILRMTEDGEIPLAEDIINELCKPA